MTACHVSRSIIQSQGCETLKIGNSSIISAPLQWKLAIGCFLNYITVSEFCRAWFLISIIWSYIRSRSCDRESWKRLDIERSSM